MDDPQSAPQPAPRSTSESTSESDLQSAPQPISESALPLLRLRTQAGRCTIECLACLLGTDVQVVVTGGQSGARFATGLPGSLPGSHVGSVALAQPRPSLTGEGQSATVSTLNLCGHKDDVVANAVAQRVSAQTGAVVCCTCGIHVDDATPQELKAIVEAVDGLVARIVEFVRDAGAGFANQS